MRKQKREFIKNFFAGVLLEGQPIQIVINDEGKTPGTGVFLLSLELPYRRVGLTFPEEWEVPTLISKEDWQAYMEASRAMAEEEQPVLPEYQEYTDPVTGMLLIVERDNPGYPDHPKLTFVGREGQAYSVGEVNEAIARLEKKASLPLHYRGSSPYTLTT